MATTRAIRIHAHGGPEVLQWEEVPLLQPGPGEVHIRHTAIGLNYVDTYHRTGLYPGPLPAGLGSEAAGVVVAVGPEVEGLKPGDRIAYGTGPRGGYAEERVMPARDLVPIPDGVDDRQAAAMMLKGMTVQYLLRSSYRVQPGDTVLVLPAAGGVGLIAGQWIKHLGATAIGIVGSRDKAELARAHGYEHVIVSGEGDTAAEIRRLTGGKGVPAVYDGVGRATFDASLDSLAPRGIMVLFGAASGPVPPFDLGRLAAKGSLSITRPTLGTFTATRADLVRVAAELFEVVRRGAVTIEVRQTFPLREAAAAHRALEGRQTTGATVLLPER